MGLLIKNGTLINPDSSLKADLLIENGIISKIETSIPNEDYQVIDAQNANILPGGIDPHVHLNLPTPNGLSADNFESGSRAALAGGTTSFIDFITPEKGQSLVEAYRIRKAEVQNCGCDYAFHMSIIEWRDTMDAEMEICLRDFGITSFKTYLAYQKSIGISFEELEKVMEAAKSLDVMITIHAEMGDIIDRLREDALKNGQTALPYHPKTRPDYTEYQAVEEVVKLVRKTQCKTYIVHVSTAESLNKIEAAQKEGLPIFAETCPQYFSFTEDVYLQEKNKALGFMMSPPIRSEKNRNGIEKGILDGVVSTLGTDHCPFTLEQKLKARNFVETPNGAGGIQHRLSVFYSHFVKTKKLPINKMVELCSSHPAQFFRLSGKGKIEIGYDADLVLWKETDEKMKDQKLYSCGDIDNYADLNNFGKADIVIKAGKIVFQNGEVKTNLASGKYLFRK
jgi:dihydropyrimidinase